jgi:GntR family transcriptional regulator
MAKRKHPSSFMVSAEIRSWLESGVYVPGQQLPPEPALAEKLGTSRVTLREALLELEEDGLVRRQHGVGTFVTQPGRMRESLHLNFGVTRLIRMMGREPGTRQATYLTQLAPAPVQSRLALDADDKVTVLERIRTADGVPVVYSIEYLPSHLTDNGPPLTESLYEYLQNQAGVTIAFGEAKVKPALADARMASLLDVQPGELMLLLEQVDFDAERRPVLYSREYHLAHAFDFVILRRDAGLTA